MKSILFFLLLIVLLAACNKDEDPAGPAGALNKPFNLVMTGLESTVAHSIVVSGDGNWILAGVNNQTNPDFWYSKNGGTTFSQVSQSMQNRVKGVVAISNQGVIINNQNQVWNLEAGTQVPVSGGEYVILGDNGKVFVYHFNSATLSFKNIGDANFQTITKPVVAQPGSANVYQAVKAPGKGVAFVVSPVTRANKNVDVHVLDEGTMTWSSYSVSVIWNNINNCNNLQMYERFTFGNAKTMIMKGCSGMAVIDVTSGQTRYVPYPVIENVVPESFRDGLTLMDNAGDLYISAGAFGQSSLVYRFKDDQWKLAFDNRDASTVVALDANGNIFYNSWKSEALVMKSPVKENVQSGDRKILQLPREKEQILDAIVLDDEIILVSALQLFRYDMASSSLTRFSLDNISHFNILSDGRWVAGGSDEIHISNDEGKTWTKTDKLFSPSVTQFQVGMTVTDTRLVNGQLMILGTSTYYYNNLTLGLTQTKHDNMLVSQSGGKQNYQFPSDMSDGVIAPDGTLYGSALFVSEFGSVSDFYIIKPGTTPTRLTIKQGPTPHIITDDGLQITLRGAVEGGGLEINTRGNVDEEWKSASEVLPNSSSFNGVMKLRAGGDGITFINGPEVYVAGN